MHPKRPRVDDDDDNADTIASAPQPRQKRQRTVESAPAAPRADLLSQLPSEILIRILSYLSLPHLLAIAPVSTRFRRLARDNQLWKALYYARFVLPRAMRIPGFREGKLAERLKDHKLHYKGRRTLWASGRSGGLVRDAGGPDGWKIRLTEEEEGLSKKSDSVNWKRQFKIRHNWARGKCAVEELRLGLEPEDGGDNAREDTPDGVDRSKMLVKVVEGLAVTADRASGLRAWDLKTREVVAQASLGDDEKETEPVQPSCIAIDDQGLEQGTLDISVGFLDGSFGVWTLSTQSKTITRRYRHEKSSNGELIGMAYSHPYLLTATEAVLISLYTFNVPEKTGDGEDEQARDTPAQAISSKLKNALSDYADEDAPTERTQLRAPYLMTSLKSYSSSPPLALSIRKTASATVASIAYTFFTRHGWSIGIQDLHITPDKASKNAPAITTRLAYTAPTTVSAPGLASGAQAGPHHPVGPASSSSAVPSQQTSDSATNQTQQPSNPPSPPPPPRSQHPHSSQGPTTLCYTHPYLLATLPDNTLILHLCTSTAAALSISPGIRLWGHTSGISDAEITARGKAVSVSSRGDEMRVWELEGRPSGVRSRSVEVRAANPAATVDSSRGGREHGGAEHEEQRPSGGDWEERRNWVGFDDEMVIVLKEARGGRESLLVYDFT
ncbi:f-box domain-containing protein [Diaporthe amygdali]|uniref:f-box domain-containing protein n=1 Tax=Phomopsis amygdali TaxID=1214568 RepID=UPI0022FF3055|nr:f-box domain-containing protein [Diaporthe amygdali]KAJ0123839.1 f-box domain-containing protein [Diaporthe amygdali]